MTRIGNYRILDTKRLIIPQNQEAWMTFLNGTEKIDLCLVFQSTDSHESSALLTIEGRADHARVIFKNWKASLGQASVDPIPIGKTDIGESISLMVVSWLIGDTRVVDVQMMIGGGE